MELGKEFTAAVSRNMMLKSRILSIIIFCILIVQFVSITVLTLTGKIADLVNPFFAWLAPVLMLAAFLTEFSFYRSTKKNLALNRENKGSILKNSYLVVFIEVTFPSFIIFFAALLMNKNFYRESNLNLLNSPPFIMYFIMIILNALSLDFSLCVFSGFIAGIEYLFLSLYFRFEGESDYLIMNIVLKSILILVCGVITGFVSSRIKEAVMLSLKSKEALISKLDAMVHEKTAEIRFQKEEIEEKQKEIIDSIKYASRIQKALITSEKYIEKNLEALMNTRTENKIGKKK